jgi:ribose/xylose/arabinose/galactoside ABC-type transport system permease subunit
MTTPTLGQVETHGGGEAPPPQSSVRAAVANVLERSRSRLALLIVIAALCAVTAARSPVFFTIGNLNNVLQQVAIVGILAAGMTMLMVSGGIDLSVGSNVSLSAMVMASLMMHNMNTVLAILIGLLVATTAGAVNGLLAAWSTSHPFILTLGMMTLLQGCALLVSNVPITTIPDSLFDIGGSEPLGVPLITWVLFAALAAVHVVLRYTKLGRWLYAIGGSQSAAHRAGIPVRVVKVLIYASNGLLVGIAALLLMIQLASSQAQMGQGLELAAIAAVAVGGTPLSGGKGDIVGTILGVVLLGLIANALNLMSIPGEIRFILQGAIIVVAVMAQRER